jgi:Fe-S oxidoreductase/nitrate reductase gamma subunit
MIYNGKLYLQVYSAPAIEGFMAPMEASREVFWNIPDRSLFWAIALTAALFFMAGLVKRTAAWHKGRKGLARGERLPGLRAALRAAFVQKGMTRGRVYVPMHLCLFYGMLLLFAGTGLVALDVHLWGDRLLRGALYLACSLALDLAGISVLVGVGLAAYKRYIVKPDRLESNFGDALLLIALPLTVLSGFVLKGLRIYSIADPWAVWSPVANAVAWLAATGIDRETARRFHGYLWYGHALLSLALIACAPWTKLLHTLAVPLNHYLSLPWAQRAALTGPIPGSLAMTGTLADCTRKQLIEADACLECGRCKKRCSIYQGGYDASPASMMKGLKGLVHSGRLSGALVGSLDGEGARGIVGDAALWSCTGCRSCEDRCPMNGAHLTTIVDLRRGCVETGRVPEEVKMRFVEDGKPVAVATDACGKPRPDYDVYIWPGCHRETSPDPTTPARLAGLLEKAGLTVAVLDPPACCGSPIRRLGNEALFQRDAALNVDYMKAVQGKTVVTHCPHCFNTLKNEYPALGGEFDVMHHSQLLARLVKEGRLSPPGHASFKAAFHDPCFLGRYNEEFLSPRRLIESAENVRLVEMKHNGRKSFCCGSGGGTVAEGPATTNGRKRVREAIKAGAEAIVTCCPYCEENLAKAALLEFPKKRVPVLDVVEIFDPPLCGEKGRMPKTRVDGAERKEAISRADQNGREDRKKARRTSLRPSGRSTVDGE